MKQEAFEARYEKDWLLCDEWIRALSVAGGRNLDAAVRAEIGREFPALYRRVCHHLSLARARRYGAGLQQRLNQLALDGHQHVYRAPSRFWGSVLRFIAREFPQAFRQRWRYVLAASLVFYLPMLLMGAAVQLKPELIYSLLEPSQVHDFESMYDPENRKLGRERDSEDDLTMFGFYVYNNIGIGFRTFAGGLLFGVGSLFFLGFNGLYFGAIGSHLTSAGMTSTFWTFVIAHGSFELTAITIFGAAGLMLGYAGIAPGRMRRWQAIRDAAIESMPLVYGGFAMLVMAAFVEAFWSSTTWPPPGVKYTVGGLLWLLVGAYLLFVGRPGRLR